MNSDTINNAISLWTYMSTAPEIEKSDAIVVCGSYDLRVCDHACKLIKAGYSDRMLISGNLGNWTRHIWTKPEATIFFERALEYGIAASQISLETAATNFGENISFSRKLMPDAESVIFVSKPNSLLRLRLALEIYWPDTLSYLSAPEIRFPDEVSNIVGVLGVINEMVGDIERIQKYPALGFQAPHKIPDDILKAWSGLIEAGFTEHLISKQA